MPPKRTMTAVTLTPAYENWYLSQTGTPARHAALEGWHIDSTWHSGGENASIIREALGRPRIPGELWHTLVCVSDDWRNNTCLNLPARFVVAAKVIQMELWSEGRAA